MCYYSLKKSRPLYKTLSDFIDKDGLLILGVQEDLANSFYNRDFQNISEEYKIFQKTRPYCSWSSLIKSVKNLSVEDSDKKEGKENSNSLRNKSVLKLLYDIPKM